MTKITAHSGSDHMADNSIAFISFFVHQPAIDAIEVDVRQDADHRLILSHDALIREQNYVFLEDVFAYLSEHSSDKVLNCDLKVPDLESAVRTLAKTYQLWEQVILSGMVKQSFLAKCPSHIYANIENAVSFRTWQDVRLQTVHQALFELADCGAEVVNIPYQLYTKDVRKKADLLGLKLSLWTVNDLTKIEQYEKEAVWNVTSRKAFAYVQYRGVMVS